MQETKKDLRPVQKNRPRTICSGCLNPFPQFSTNCGRKTAIFIFLSLRWRMPLYDGYPAYAIL